jgi:hypothetical protein
VKNARLAHRAKTVSLVKNDKPANYASPWTPKVNP